MGTCSINLDTIDKVNQFFKVVNQYNCDVDLLSSTNPRYCVDAKSLLGIYALNLASPLKVKIITEDENVIQNFLRDMRNFQD